MVVTACQTQAVMWEPCAKAADGNPWGTDGAYVLACNDGIWQPVMTVGEYLRLTRGEKFEIAPVPTRPGTGGPDVVVQPTTPPTPPPTTPPTTVPPTTTVPPGTRAVDQSNAAATIGDGLMTCDNEYTRAQVFTAGRTGTLDGVSLRTSGSVAATVQIRRVALDGSPTGAQIGSGTYRGGSGAQWTEVSLSSPAAVEAGSVYAAVISTASGCTGEWSVAVTADAYAGGTSFYRVPENPAFVATGEDLAFRTWVR